MKSSVHIEGEDGFYRYIDLSKKILSKEQKEDLDRYFENYIKGGLRAVSHSNEYKKANSPSYRLIDTYKARIIPILEKITKLKKQRCVIAIDGRAASGKSTAADILSFVTEADVIRMDDFFLPLSLRSHGRYEEAGGNIHYERFKDEIVDKISEENEISYGKFDCSVMDITERITVKSNRLLIIEGVYSQHPYFGNYADIKAFFDVDKTEQIERIIKRNGSEMAKRFESVWIPLEEKYYSEFRIKEKSDIVL
jgi:uridine kinase